MDLLFWTTCSYSHYYDWLVAFGEFFFFFKESKLSKKWLQYCDLVNYDVDNIYIRFSSLLFTTTCLNMTKYYTLCRFFFFILKLGNNICLVGNWQNKLIITILISDLGSKHENIMSIY